MKESEMESQNQTIILERDRDHDIAHILLDPTMRNQRGVAKNSMIVFDKEGKPTNLVLDFDGEGRLIGIELIADASRVLPYVWL